MEYVNGILDDFYREPNPLSEELAQNVYSIIKLEVTGTTLESIEGVEKAVLTMVQVIVGGDPAGGTVDLLDSVSGSVRDFINAGRPLGRNKCSRNSQTTQRLFLSNSEEMPGFLKM